MTPTTPVLAVGDGSPVPLCVHRRTENRQPYPNIVIPRSEAMWESVLFFCMS